MSYDPYGHDTPEYSHPKVATMDKLRKEANEYHDPDWKRSEGHQKIHLIRAPRLKHIMKKRRANGGRYF